MDILPTLGDGEVGVGVGDTYDRTDLGHERGFFEFGRVSARSSVLYH